jgi:hypothetical protein
MQLGRGFSRFVRAIRSKDKDAVIPTKPQYKRITEKAARKRAAETFGFPSRWNISRVHHFGTFRPLKPL